MSFAIASESIFKDRRLSGADIRVLLALTSHTRPNKAYCWPSRARLAELIGIKSHSRVSEILARLVSLGWISIKRTGRSNLYFVHAPCPTSDIHHRQDIEDRSEYLEEENPLPLVINVEPLGCNVILEADTPIEQQPEPLHCNVILETDTQIDIAGAGTDATTEQPTRAHEESHQGEPVETTEHRETVEPTESAPAPAPAQSHKPDAASRQIAIQRVLERLEQITGIKYAGRATERRIARRIDRYGLAMILAVITSKAADFQHPLVLLRPSVLESVAAEIEAETRARQQAIERDQKALADLRTSQGTRTREGALRGIQSLKQALGMRPKPDTDGQMRA